MQEVHRVSKYVGTRFPGGDALVFVTEGKCSVKLDPGYHYVNHSPTGFNWGYDGSGPAQLAFAILLDHYRAPGPALLFHQDFKQRVIAMLNTDRWELSTVDVETALKEIRLHRTHANGEKGWEQST